MDPKLSPKIYKDQFIMLTLTFDNSVQKAEMTLRNRLRAFSDFIHKAEIIKRVSLIFNRYDMNLEISEPLASDGSKFPRLHYHILGDVRCPISYLLQMGQFKQKWNIGYHSTLINDASGYEHYDSYIHKQNEQWQSSIFNIAYRHVSEKRLTRSYFNKHRG